MYKQRFYVRFGNKPDDWFYIEFKTEQRYMNGEWVAEKERELYGRYKNAKEIYLIEAGLKI